MNKNPRVVWWTLSKSNDADWTGTLLPFEVEILSIKDRNDDGSPKTIEIKMISFKAEPTDIVFSVPSDSLTDLNNNTIDVDRELALTAHDNVIEFPKRVWIT